MSLITRCPACSTLFRVVPDQLRISDGWVRCGHCEEVFDGNAHLQSLEAPQSVPAQPSPDQAYDWGEVLGSASGADRAGAATEAKSVPPPVGQTVQSAAALAPAQAPVAETSMLEPEVPPSVPAATDQAVDPVLHISPGEVLGLLRPEASHSLGHALDSALKQELEISPKVERNDWAPDALEAEPEPAASFRYVQADTTVLAPADHPQISFLAPQQTAAESPWPRGLLAALALLLTLLLGLQVLVQERDRLAAGYPVLRPILETACSAVGCEIQPLRQIEAVVIDSSAFAKVRGDVFRLNFTLKNAASMEVAAPSLELTLTDMEDQTLARKVLDPMAYLGAKHRPGAGLAAGLELQAQVPVQVKLPLNPQRVSGYRLLVFYP